MRDLFPASLANAASGFHHVVDLVLEVAPEPTGHDEAIEVLAQLGRDHRSTASPPNTTIWRTAPSSSNRR